VEKEIHTTQGFSPIINKRKIRIALAQFVKVFIFQKDEIK
jgi:hypothetical protein